MRNAHINGTGLIALERARQIHEKGWTPEHDAQHVDGELAQLASYYCAHNDDEEPFGSACLFPALWPSNLQGREGYPTPTLRDIVKAGALIAAEIDRRLAAGEEA